MLGLLEGLSNSFALSVLNSSLDCIKLIELDGSLSFMNTNGLCAMEIDDFSAIEGRPWPSLWPKDAQTLLQNAIEDAALGLPSEFEAFCPTARRNDRWWHVSVVPVCASDGRVERIMATSRDISNRVSYENRLTDRDHQLTSYARELSLQLEEKNELIERQKLLMGEIDHRVKNSFALITGILRLQMREMAEPAAVSAINDAVNRIGTLARVHEQLHMHAEATMVELYPFLCLLLDDLASVMTDHGKIDVGPVANFPVPANVAVPLGLITAELVGNALKHGAPKDVPMVRFSLVPCDAGETSFRLSVSDDGVGLPHGFDVIKSTGLGIKICRVYAEQIGATFESKNGDLGGAQFDVIFPRPIV
ncbi:sensor histidine kinase [Litoreibacter roseus]|uniref:histidine kinase n=1 Tax=Litoreibacter roseus TaxID=2601869 RepID=A0A6N6JMT0_9RHOB|nr:histidine kinase dimerization/phosphoacceptor domain -containing protein [Litoreibacter roseus]GFE66618.1 hypothetical protein KIN_36920 [Litoreibacter roseus]